MVSPLWDQSPLEEGFANDQRRSLELQVQRLLGSLIQVDQYVGDVYSIGYETALVQIHDFHRERVGGIPSLCFLIGEITATGIVQKSGDTLLSGRYLCLICVPWCMAEEAVCKGGRDPLREWLDKTYIVFAQHPCQGISNYFTHSL